MQVQPPYPFNQSLLSSEESEDDEQEEAPDLPASPWHPKPLRVSGETYRTTAAASSWDLYHKPTSEIFLNYLV